MALHDFFWWLGAGVLIVAELLTGTFYLLMIALGFLAGGIVHLFGARVALELTIAALVAFIAVMVLRRSRFGRRQQRRDVSADPNVNFDIGATLEIVEWHARAARVQYRGTQWDAQLAPGESEHAQIYRIHAVRGNRLIVVANK